jgi:hypothetical protein
MTLKPKFYFIKASILIFFTINLKKNEKKWKNTPTLPFTP